MEALLAYGYAQKNAGDMAVTLGSIDLLMEAGFHVTVMSRYFESQVEYEESSSMLIDRYSDSINILPCLFKLDRNAKWIPSLANYLYSLSVLIGLKKYNKAEAAITQSNAVFFNGGNLLRCNSIIDAVRLIALTYPLSKAKKRNKLYFILPQSTAINNFLGRRLISKILRGADHAYAREGISFDCFKNIAKGSRIKQSLDMAFYINDNNVNEFAKKEGTIIAITLRGLGIGDLKEFNSQKKNKITSYFVQLCCNAPQDTKFVLVSQGKKDTEFTEKLALIVSKKSGKKVEWFEELNPIALGRFFSSCSALIGMRLHSIILASSRGTPAFGVFYREWGNKNPGLMNDLNLNYTFLDDDKDIIFPNLAELEQSKKHLMDTLLPRIQKEKTELIRTIQDNVQG